MAQVNRLLFDTTAAERYVTVFYGVYDSVENTLTYANAGHYPPWLIGKSGVTRLDSLTAPVGMFADVPAVEYCVQLSSEDWLVAVSDGIPEACDEHGREFGDQRVLALLNASGMTSREFCDAVMRAVVGFSGERQADDLTLLAARLLSVEGDRTQF